MFTEGISWLMFLLLWRKELEHAHHTVLLAFNHLSRGCCQPITRRDVLFSNLNQTNDLTEDKIFLN